MNHNELVKLVPNAFVKDILQKAKEAKHDIEVDEAYFMVRDKKTNYVVFRGIRIRNNCWGLTFLEHFWKESGVFGEVIPVNL